MSRSGTFFVARLSEIRLVAAALILSLGLASCGGGGDSSPSGGSPPPAGGGGGVDSYTIGGTVSGLVGTGGGLIINDGYEDLAINGNGGFTFPSAIFNGFPYSVIVDTQPSAPAQMCTVANGSGTVSGPVSNVQVVCRNTITFSITGLVGNAVLQNNGADNLSVSADGTYTFTTPVATGSGYAVTIASKSIPQQCTVTNGSGNANGNVTNVQIGCVNTIGGQITGLTGTVVLQNNGGDNLARSANGAFTFTTPVATGGGYNVTVLSQPVGQTCLVIANGSGGVYGNVTNVELACANGQWTWMGGSSSANQLGIYGTKGTPSATNIPGGRYGAAGWTDSANGQLWLFGGRGFPETMPNGIDTLNDLWRYDIASGEWTWMSGANTESQNGTYGTKGVAAAENVPGSREYAASWIDASGDLWLFGGNGYAEVAPGTLNDLWKYDTSTGQWAWMSGSKYGDNLSVAPTYGTKGTAHPNNVPGGRYNAVSWADTSGNLWLFGGYGWDSPTTLAVMNDLWRYNIASGEWTWVSGSSVGNQVGTYGTKGVANAANVPGARQSAMGWFDPSGKLWLFGGSGFDSVTLAGYLNDLWQYDTATGQWTWMSGSNMGGQTATYGTMGVASASNVPGARKSAASQIDGDGNLWLFSGTASPNDLWKYNIASGQWTWMTGMKVGGMASTYGTLGVAGTSVLGQRQDTVSWIDANANLWFFGGYTGGHMNDLWRFK